jgi:transcription termination factor Rho
MTTRIIDLFAPIGRGQRAMIVAPPKAGKTILLHKIAHALHANHPDVRVICLLIDERPEEVTDFRRGVPAEVHASCSDQTVDEHVQTVEDTFLSARESVLAGHDVVILMDSLTRLARAYNQYTESSGKTLSGGLDSAAMQRPRKFFGAARNIDNGGSLTVIATALIETGSRMDEIIFQEFKGTGNTEIVLSRKLAEQRMFPAIDLNQTGTRREERLFTPEVLMKIRMLRRALSPLQPLEAMMLLMEKLKKTETNEDFLKSITVS